MAIAISGTQVQLREVVLKHKPRELVLASAKATVPVLVHKDGNVLEQSLDILHWALSNDDPDGWKNFPEETLSDMASFVEENDFSFKTHLDHYKYADRFPEEPQEVYRQRCQPFLQKLETRLQQKPYLFAGEISYADIAVFPFIRQFSKVDEPWFASAPYPALRVWLENLTQSELFESIMEKHKPWQADQPITFFPSVLHQWHSGESAVEIE